MWCCKSCIGIIKLNKEATYQRIREEVEIAAAKRMESLPVVTGVDAGQIENAAGAVPLASEPSAQSLASSQGASDQATLQGVADTRAPNPSLGDVSHHEQHQHIINSDTSDLVGATRTNTLLHMVSSDLVTQPQLPKVTGVHAGQFGNAAGVPSAGYLSSQTLTSSQGASDQASPQGEVETQALGDVSHQRHQQSNIDTANLVGESGRTNQQRMVSSDLATQPHMMQEMQRQTDVLIEIKEELAKTRGATGATVKNCNCDIL